MKMTRDLTLAAVLLAISVILPVLTHILHIPGEVFLPMHFPVLLAGLTLGPQPAALVGAAAPVLNFALTGRPPLSPPIMPMMVFELAAYGLFAGLAYRGWKIGVIPSLLLAMVSGRIVLGLAAWAMVLVAGFKGNPVIFAASSIPTGVPGIIIQLVFIPLLLRSLRRPGHS